METFHKSVSTLMIAWNTVSAITPFALIVSNNTYQKWTAARASPHGENEMKLGTMLGGG